MANPKTQVPDFPALSSLCKEHGLIFCADNTLPSPISFAPENYGADLTFYSLTKGIAGHGNVLGGVVFDHGTFPWETFTNLQDKYKKGNVKDWGLLQVRKLGLRDFGASLDPEAASRIGAGMETLSLRLERSSQNAYKLAHFLEKLPEIDKVFYPGLKSHPQHQFVKSHFRLFGNLLSFTLMDSQNCDQFLRKLKLPVHSTNLGDNRTLIIPVGRTIYHEFSPSEKSELEIENDLLRVSVGIEAYEDIANDFEKAVTMKL